jgi:transposase InsO family protein
MPRLRGVPDLVRRGFTVPVPGLELVGGISSFPASGGWLCLATVLDLCSKELIGYAIAPRMRASLAIGAISTAHRAGLTPENTIMHTGRGGRYRARSYQNAVQRLGVRQSTSRTGSCLDGAAAGSFFATIKAETGAGLWPDRASARRDIENWITRYSQRRLHCALGYKTPSETRTAWQQRMSTAA